MHNWHLLVFVIHSLLQPIWSEDIFIDGGRQCIHSSSSSASEGRISWQRQYRFNNQVSETRGLNDRSETRRNKYPNEGISTSFFGQRSLKHRSLAPDSQSWRNDDRKLYKSIGITNVNDERFTFPNLHQNDRAKDTPLKLHRLDRKARREHSTIRLNSCSETRTSLIGHPKSETNTKIFAENDIIIRNVDRTTDTDLKNKDNRIYKYLMTQNLRQRDLTRVSNNDRRILTDSNIVHDLNRANKYLWERTGIIQNNDRPIIRSKDRTVSPSEQQKENIPLLNRSKKTLTERSVRTRDIRDRANKDREYGTYNNYNVRETDVTRVSGEQLAHSREERNTNKRDESTYIRNNKYTSNNIREVGLQVDVRNTDKQDAHNIMQRNTNLRYNPKDARENVRDSPSSIEMILPLDLITRQQDVSKNTKRQITRSPEKKNRIPETRDSVRANESGERIFVYENMIRQSSTNRVNDVLEAHRSILRNSRIGKEYMDIANIGWYSRDYIREKSSFERDIRNEATKRRLNREFNDNRKNGNIRYLINEPTQNKNPDRHSKATRDEIVPLRPIIRQENMKRTTNINRIPNRKGQNTKVRNESSTRIRNEGYTRDAMRARTTLSLERTLPYEEVRRISEKSFTYTPQEQQSIENNEPTTTRYYKMYSTHNTRDRTSSKRDERNENVRRIISRHNTPYGEERNMNERNKLTNTWSYQEDSKDTPKKSFKGSLRQGNAGRITDLDYQNRRERKTNIRNESINTMNHDERHSLRDDARERSTLLFDNDADLRRFTVRNIASKRHEPNSDERNQTVKVYSRANTRMFPVKRIIRQQNIRQSTDRQYFRSAKQGYVENAFIHKRNTETYLQNNRPRNLSLKHREKQDITRRITERHVVRNGEEASTNVRKERLNVRNYETHLRDIYVRTLSIERGVPQKTRGTVNRRNALTVEEGHARNEVMYNKNFERYIRDSRDSTLSLQPSAFKWNAQKTTDVQNGKERKKNFGNDLTNIRNYENHSTRGNSRRQASAFLINETRQSEKSTEKYISVYRQERKSRDRNERSNRRGNEKVTKRSTSKNIVSFELDIRQQGIRTTMDVHRTNHLLETKSQERIKDALRSNDIARQEIKKRTSNRVIESICNRQNTNERNMRTVINRDQRYLTDSVLDQALSAIRLEDRLETRRVTDIHRSRNREVSQTIRGNKSTDNHRALNDVRYLQEDTNKMVTIYERIRAYPHRLDKRDSFVNRFERITRYLRNDGFVKNADESVSVTGKLTPRDRGSNRDFRRRNNDNINMLSPINNKLLAGATETLRNYSSLYYFLQYLFYVLQGIYVICIFMQEKPKPSSIGWLNSSRFIKVD